MATDGDPASFGTPSTDLVARLSATLGTTEPGLYGDADPFAAGTNQSLALLALTAAAAPVPGTAVEWLVDQQCGGGTTPADAVGGWQAYRAPTVGGLEECLSPDPGAFAGPDTNTTGFAVQALVAVGNPEPIPAAPHLPAYRAGVIWPLRRRVHLVPDRGSRPELDRRGPASPHRSRRGPRELGAAPARRPWSRSKPG